MKSKVWYLGILSSAISSICSLFEIKSFAVVFAIISLLALIMAIIMKE
ncbi:MAG: hypothetical protein ACLU8V_07495 [Oscillospiraceae bacterium]